MLERVTITGIDERVSLGELFELQTEFPLVEWGVLFSVSRGGSPRYPRTTWITDALLPTMNRHQLRCALHVCGRSAIRAALTGLSFVQFPRIQLNFSYPEYVDDIPTLVNVVEHSTVEIITQYNEENKPLLSSLGTCENHSILFDASGGNGIKPEGWHPYLTEPRWCGYAGGLSPDNLAEQLPLIEAASGGNSYWIDMESGVRDNQDRLDIDKVQEVLRIATQFRSKQCYNTQASQAGAMLRSDDTA